jgi:broad specificity phosphatase PhoE
VLVIVRHGRTAHNASGLLLGRLDPPLDELGRTQAAALAAEVGPVDRVISSPLLRTRETAEAFGCDVEIDDRWIELDYGDFDGVPAGDLGPDVWARWRADIDFCPPGGETLRQLGDRVRGALDEMVEETTVSSGTTVVVTHVSPVKAAVGWAVGADDEISWRLWVAPASITRMAISPRGGVLHSFNETAHLTP